MMLAHLSGSSKQQRKQFRYYLSTFGAQRCERWKQGRQSVYNVGEEPTLGTKVKIADFK